MGTFPSKKITGESPFQLKKWVFAIYGVWPVENTGCQRGLLGLSLLMGVESKHENLGEMAGNSPNDRDPDLGTGDSASTEGRYRL